MVYKYVRKTDRGSWSKENLRKALDDIQNNKLRIKTAARQYSIPRTTLIRHLQKNESTKNLGRFMTVFSPEQERQLSKYVAYFNTLFLGLRKKDFLKLAYDYAVKMKLPHPFKNGKAGDDWYIGFKRRNPDFSLNSSKPTSRAKRIDLPLIEHFYSLSPTIYNVDKTEDSDSDTKPPNILSTEGKKQVDEIRNTENGYDLIIKDEDDTSTSMTDHPLNMIVKNERINGGTHLPLNNTDESPVVPGTSCKTNSICDDKPIPNMAKAKTRRKSKRLLSNSVMEEPSYKLPKKEQIFEQFIKPAKSVGKSIKKNSEVKEVPGPSPKKRGKKKTTSVNNFSCLVCSEKYVKRPCDDWIQCNECKKWAHEMCTLYKGYGSYFCDECDD